MQTANYTFTTHGDGLWGCDERTVTITGFEISRYTAEDIADGVDWAEEGDIAHVAVLHDSTWDVYTDTGFREAARYVTGIADLDFTEQGMQDDGVASMEV